MREEKQLLLDEIKEKIDGSKAFVLTRYNKLTPDLSDHFRNVLHDVGGDFSVIRKRILLKAAEKTGIPLDSELLEGHIGVVFAYDDPITTTKALFSFAKENEDILEVLSGQFEGRLCPAKDVKAISELPSQDEMRAQFLGLLEVPMAQTLSVMESLLTSIIFCLENKSQKE